MYTTHVIILTANPGGLALEAIRGLGKAGGGEGVEVHRLRQLQQADVVVGGGGVVAWVIDDLSDGHQLDRNCLFSTRG